MKEIHCVVTDESTPEDYLRQLAEAGISVVRATEDEDSANVA